MIAGPAALSGQARPASFIQVVRPEKLEAKPLRCQPPRPSCYLLGTRLGRQLGFAEVAQYWQERDIIEQVGCGRLSASPQVLAAEDQLQTSRIIRHGGYGFSSWCATTVEIVAKYCTAVLQTYLPVWSNFSAPSTAAELLLARCRCHRKLCDGVGSDTEGRNLLLPHACNMNCIMQNRQRSVHSAHRCHRLHRRRH